MEKSGPILLIVEDDEDCREMLKSIIELRFPDAEVLAARNGRDGLEQFEKRVPRIVITDVNMPEMGGVQMVDRILQIEPATRIIVLTADTENRDLESVLGRSGSHRYLLKPVDYQDLFDAIAQFCGEAAG